ncbi:MAG: hypothetical protein ABI723_01255 [Bacteroidia bacterium]
MKTIYILTFILFALGFKINRPPVLQLESRSHDCLKHLRQNPSLKIPKDLVDIKNKLEHLDFFISNNGGKIERIISSLPFKSDSIIIISDTVCARFDNYNIFFLSVRKKNIYKNSFYPSFELTRYDFVSERASEYFFEFVLGKVEKTDILNKQPYVYLQSGKSCYKIATQAYLYYYDFMNQVVKQVNPDAKRINHLL